MAAKRMIAVKEFCTHHNLETDFIKQLQHHDLIEMVMVKRTGYIVEKNLPIAEKAARLHNELNVNIEGIHAIFQLLSLVEKKEQEIIQLRRELEFYK
ncbi:MAG: hypothetical protein JST81_11515 [Bacteroidetes bacterium]|jgi:hypothetical protein|nr:hypothetical protein [Bacteroidota bacterium]